MHRINGVAQRQSSEVQVASRKSQVMIIANSSAGVRSRGIETLTTCDLRPTVCLFVTAAYNISIDLSPVMAMALSRPIVILGPTAGGKSDLAVGLAERLRGEVIGADSMQVYRHLNAGTAKPSHEVRRRVAHHLIDVVEPTERFTVADWLKGAETLIDRLQRQSTRAIVVGGTNLYIRALLEGMFDGPGIDRSFRDRAADVLTADLHQRLEAIDPEAARRIHVNDRQRIVRALEVEHLTGRPISAWQEQWDGDLLERDDARSERLNVAPTGDDGSAEPSTRVTRTYRHDPILIGLRWPVEAINRRINQRVRAMFYPDRVDPEVTAALNITESLPTEVRRLDGAGLLGPQARQAIGYKQLIGHMQGRCDLDEAFEKTKIVTRRFARQQRTWMRRFVGVGWIDAGQDDIGRVLDAAILHVSD